MKKLTITALGLLSVSCFSALTSISYAEVAGTTNTGLDKIIQVINADEGLKNRSDATDPKKVVTQQDIDVASTSANGMNAMIISAIRATGIANDGAINTADARELNDYIFKNYNAQWKAFHGDDDAAKGIETGYHRVQNDGGNTILFGQNALNTVFDSIYHLGYETSKKNKLLNEDGNNNATFATVGFWLDSFLQNDLKAGTLKNGAIVEIKGTTGTGLDKIIEYLKADVGLNQNVKTSDLIAGERSADEMNKILIEAFKNTGVTNDGSISEADVRELNLYISTRYLQKWTQLHGDDDQVGQETGFHLVQNDGASKKMFKKNAVNTVFDGIYHLGFVTTNKNRLKNEDGNDNATFKDVASWLDGLMGDDIRNNANIKNGAFTGMTVVSGDWYALPTGYKGAYFTGNGIGLLSSSKARLSSGSTFQVTMNVVGDGKAQNGFVVFDYVSPTNFKYVGARVGGKAWVIGQYKDGQYSDLKKSAEPLLSIGKDYTLSIGLTGNTLTLKVDGVEKIKYTFTAALNSTLGFAVDRGSVEFKNIK